MTNPKTRISAITTDVVAKTIAAGIRDKFYDIKDVTHPNNGLEFLIKKMTRDLFRFEIVAGDEDWRPIETVPMDGREVLLACADGSDFGGDVPDREDVWVVKTRWVDAPDLEYYTPALESGLYYRSTERQPGYWLNLPGQCEYVFAWRYPVRAPQEYGGFGKPLDTRTDDFNKLRNSQTFTSGTRIIE